MIRKRGRLRRQLIVLASIVASTADLAQGFWRSGPGKRWMIPLAVFLCLTGALLVFAVSVEALAPFIYAVF